MAASIANKRPEDKETFCAARCAAAGEMADRNVRRCYKQYIVFVRSAYANRDSGGTIHLFLTSALDGLSDQPHASATLNPDEMPPYTF